LNATYKVDNKTNLRFSASQTVIRPELRELAGLALYDFELNATVSGNPSLVRTKITNLDFRYELYQRAGEAITAGVFYKNFRNPIEQQMEQGGQNFTFRNTEKAQTYGAELELRKKLDALDQTLKNFTFQVNAAYIYSKVTDTKRNIDRPLVGQSPYLLNVSLMYDLEEKGFNTTLLFNQIGKRIYLLGDVAFGGGRPDIWEAPRPVLDWQISKKLMNKKAEIRLNVTDLLNQKLYFFQNSDSKTSLQKNDDAYRFTRKYGSRLSVTFNYSF
jgi:outer membrane receptor protein involved in Fe transport